MKSDFAHMGDNYFLFFLRELKGVGSSTLWPALKKFGSAKKLYEAAHNQHPDLNNKLGEIIRQAQTDKQHLETLEKNINCLQEDHLTIFDKDYPQLLKNIYDPPLIIFYKGNIELLNNPYLLTIVGSRTLSTYHAGALRKIISQLTYSPLVIASGLARGIDALSHQAALDYKLPTVAVLASGLDTTVIYPQSNLKLADNIINKGGLLISEYPAKSKPELYHFPKRNRILAGLSRATIIISAALKSGALITAQVAIDENREVLALPGNINQVLSQGTNQLIKSGAQVLTDANDILKIYKLDTAPETPLKHIDDALQNQIYQLLRIEPLDLESLAQKLKTDLTSINIAVSKMEIAGLVKVNYFNQIEII